MAAINAGTSTGDAVTTTELVDADLTANGNELVASTINFSNINDADLSGGALTGTNDNDETFEISTTANAVSVNAIDFTSVASIDAGTSTGDAITTTETVDADLTANGNELTASTINFSNINDADLSGGALTGTNDNDETFEIDTTANAVNVNAIDFTSVAAINAGTSTDDAITTTEAVDATLTGTNNAVDASGINFTNINTAGLTGGALSGSDNADTFVLDAAGLKANEILFTAINSLVNAGGGLDDVTGMAGIDWALTANAGELSSTPYQFTGIETADLVSQTLSGTDANNETFSISTAANAVNVNDIDFTSVAAINAGTSTGDVVTTTEAIDADLTANGNELVASTINFSNINDADLSGGALTGTNDNDETFEISTTANAVNVNAIDFTSVAAINAGTSTGDAVTTTETVDADLTANGNELVASEINFSNINDADLRGGALTGTDTNDETFEISTTANAVNVNSIDFTSVAAINAGTSTGDAVTTTETVNADLTANGNELVASTINFSNINDADLSGGALTGTNDNDETFEIDTTDNAVNVNAIDFTSVAAINAGTSTGDAITTTEAVDATLTGADNAVDASGINFTNVNTADLTGGALSGSDNADTFVLDAAGLKANEILFTAINSLVNAEGGLDDVTGMAGIDWTLTANTGELSSTSYQFIGIETADLVSQTLSGTDANNETFEISTTDNAVNVNDIDFTSVAAINAGTSTGDAVTTTELVNADLTANGNELVASTINFSNINDADLSGGALTGTNDNDETFEIDTTDNAVNVNAIDFTSVAAINAGTSTGDAITTTETVDADLTANGNELVASTINFSNINDADLSGGALTGTNDNDETFEIDTTDNAVNVNAIDFTSVAAINAGTSTGDAITTTEAVDATLTGADNAADASNINFTNINTADLTGGALSGSDNADTFVLDAAGLKANEILFTAINSLVNAGGGLDDVTGMAGIDWALTANAGELSSTPYQFTGIETADLVSQTLSGTDANNETFEISTTDNAVNVNDIDFTSVAAINAGTSTGDAVTTTETVDADLTANGNELVASTINFSNINDADLSGGALTGTNNNNETFSISTTANAVNVNAIDFTSVAAINAGTSTGDAVTTTETVNADLTANGNELVASTINFSNINDADLSGGALTGTDTNDETFSISTTDNAVDVNDIDFTSVTAINAGTSTGDAVATTETVDADLTANGNELVASTINFSNINDADLSGGALTGTNDNDETFEIDTTANAVNVNAIDFTSVAAINAGTSTDDAITTTEAVDATLTGTNNAVDASGINFTNINTAGLTGGALSGSDNADTFVLDAAGLKANEILFTAINSLVNAGGGLDDVTGMAGIDWALTANAGELSSTSYQFTGIETADLVSQTLSGTDANNETFEISTTANAVNVNAIDFTSVASINAGTSTGDAVTTTEAVDADLTANGNELAASTINFSNINDADLSGGALTGTNDNDETFSISTAANAVNVNDIDFTSVAAINAGTSTGDVVTTTEAIDADLTANGNELTASTINFSNINDADLSGGALTGTNDNDETFEINTAANAVNVNAIDFTSVAAINAGTSTGDAVTTTELVNADLTANGNELVASTINFSNINDADLSGGALTGTNDSDETFSISTTANAVNVNDIDLTSVASINAGTSTGDAITTTEAVDATLTGTDNAVDASGINFTNINTADLTGGALSGSDNADTFVLDAAGLKANEILFTAINSLVNAEGGLDDVTGMAGIDWALTANAGELSSTPYQFTGIATADLVSQTLNGTDANNETFSISTTANAVNVNDIDFTSVAAINAGTSTGDAVTTTETVDADLTANGNELVASTINFSNINDADLSGGALTGTNDNDETFSISTTANAVDVNDINFTSVASIDAGTSTGDAVTMTELVNADLTANGNELVASEINFSNINDADLSGGALTGTDTNDETFEISTTANAVNVNSIDFTSVAAINAGTSTGDAVTTTETVNADLTANGNELTASTINFSNINDADLSGGQLTGTNDNDETFEIDTTANAVNVNAIDFTSVASINAGTSTGDAITTTEAVDATLTGADNAADASNINFTNINTADLTGGALSGSDNADTFVLDAAGLKANEILFIAINSLVNAGGGLDDVTGMAGIDWTLTANAGELSSTPYLFTGIETADLVSQALTGTDTNNETFSISTTDNAVNVNDIDFTSVASINAGTSTGDAITTTETVNADLTANGNEIVASTINFSNINDADLSGGALTGTNDNDETFEISTAANAVNVNDIDFTSVAAINAGTSTGDAVTTTETVDADLTANGNELVASTINFSNINDADLSGGALTGTNDNDETFEIDTTNNAVNVNDIDFTSVASINAGTSTGDAVTTTETVNADLTANGNELVASTINFSNINDADLSGGALTGTNDNDETFEIDTTDNAVNVNAIDFTSVAAINAGTSTGDAITTTEAVDATLTGTNNAVDASGINFTNINTAGLTGGALSGSDNADTFVLDAAGLKANEILFTAINSQVNAEGGLDDVTGMAGIDWMLTANAGELSSTPYQFTGIETADLVSQALTGTDTNNETFSISTTANAVNVNSIDFTSVAAINAGTSNGDAITTTEAVDATLAGADNAVDASSINFTNINTAGLTGGALSGSDNADTFVLDAAGLKANEILFTAINSLVNAEGGLDDVTGIAGIDWTLTANTGELSSTPYQFTGIETADLVSQTLNGTDANNETFSISTTANAVNVNAIDFTSVAAINAGTSTGDAVTTTELVDAALTANGNELVASTINFSNINDADLSGGELTGTNTNDEVFEIDTTANAVNVNAIDFTSVASINAGTSANDAIITTTLVDAALVLSDNGLTASSMTFSNINNVDLSLGALTGTDGRSETFNITTASQSVNVNGMDFTQVSTVSAGTSGSDAVIADGIAVNADLTDSNNGLVASDITFTNINQADLNDGALTGTDANNETFTIGADANAVTVNAIDFTQVSAVDAGSSANDSIVASGAAVNADLTASNNGLVASGIAFSNIERAALNNGALTGTDAIDEIFTVSTVDNFVNVNAIDFTQVSAVNAGSSVADSIATDSAVNAELSGDQNGLIASDISFSNINSANLSGGSLTGSNNVDTLSLTVLGLVANNIDFTFIDSFVDLAGGYDEITGLAGVDWTLTGADGEINSTRYQFANIEEINVVGESVTGSSSAETFELGSSTQGVIVNELQLNDVASVNAGESDTLQGTSGDDIFDVTSDAVVEANSTTFSGMKNLNGSGGQDTLISNTDGLAWIINDGKEGLNTLGSYSFTLFELLDNNVGDLTLTTALQSAFSGDGVSLNVSGSTTTQSAAFGGMFMNFNSANNVSLISTLTGSNAVTGNITANQLSILASGDINIDTDINQVDIGVNDGRSIGVVMVQDGDLVVGLIDSGENGSIILDSAVSGTGKLTSAERNSVNFSGNTAQIGTGNSGRSGSGTWFAAGDAATGSQLTFDITTELTLEAFSYVTPFFPNGSPLNILLEGIETESLISSQQPALIVTGGVENFDQVDQGVFESLTPYVADANAVAGSDNYYASSDVPSSLDTSQLAVLLEAYQPTAAGLSYGEYTINDGESDEEEDKDEEQQEQQSNTVVADGDIRVAYNDSGEILGVVKEYVFQAGDSLWSLSSRFLGDGFAWRELLSRNPTIKDPASIVDGQVINVVEKVSDEISQKLKGAIDAGFASQDSGGVVLPAALRDELALP
ncbi:MAG: LysM peptidoglycan-binding domain-containing protein [Thalassolituus sp.]